MKPIQFKEVNTTFAKNQPPYGALPSYRCNDKEGTTVFCWQLSLKERIELLLTGKVWHMVKTFNSQLQPQFLTTEKPQM